MADDGARPQVAKGVAASAAGHPIAIARRVWPDGGLCRMHGEGKPQGLIELSHEEAKVRAVSFAVGKTGVEHLVADDAHEVFLVAGEEEVPAEGKNAATIVGAADAAGAKLPKSPGKADPLHLS